MKLLIDSADVTAIKRIMEYYPIDGVTTNPTILYRSGRRPDDVLPEIRRIIGDLDLHVQVISQDSESIIEEADAIRNKLGNNTFIKIPITFEGVKAVRILSDRGVRCTGTAIYTLEQAFLSAKAGALWIAPYVNRIETLGGNGVETVCRMKEMLYFCAS